MPLNVNFTPYETNKTRPLAPITVPKTAILNGQENGARHFIYIRPLVGDYGAEIHKADEQSAHTCVLNGITYHNYNLDGDTLDKVMLAGSSHEIDNVCINDELGRLALQHSAPTGLIISEN